MVVFGAAEISCALFYYLIDNWRIVWIVFAAVPAIIGLILSFFIYETPKFYLTQDDQQKVNNNIYLRPMMHLIKLQSSIRDQYWIEILL